MWKGKIGLRGCLLALSDSVIDVGVRIESEWNRMGHRIRSSILFLVTWRKSLLFHRRFYFSLFDVFFLRLPCGNEDRINLLVSLWLVLVGLKRLFPEMDNCNRIR